MAGLYAVVTLPQARRRGIGTAMTVAPLRDARSAGHRTATLQDSAGGQGLYARLGYLPCAAFREYKLPRSNDGVDHRFGPGATMRAEHDGRNWVHGRM